MHYTPVSSQSPFRPWVCVGCGQVNFAVVFVLFVRPGFCLPSLHGSKLRAGSIAAAWCASGHPLRLMTVTRGRLVGEGEGERGEGAMSNAAFVRSALLLASHDSGGRWGRSFERIKANVLSQRTNKDIAGKGRGVEGMNVKGRFCSQCILPASHDSGVGWGKICL